MEIVRPLPRIPSYEIHPFQSANAESLDRLLGTKHGVLLDRDRVSCLAIPGQSVVGVIAWRPGGIVHELRVGNGLGQKQRADLLVDYAIRDALAVMPWKLSEAIFVVDNDRMAKYVRELGAIEEVGSKVFTLDIRRAK